MKPREGGRREREFTVSTLKAAVTSDGRLVEWTSSGGSGIKWGVCSGAKGPQIHRVSPVTLTVMSQSGRRLKGTLGQQGRLAGADQARTGGAYIKVPTAEPGVHTRLSPQCAEG